MTEKIPSYKTINNKITSFQIFITINVSYSFCHLTRQLTFGRKMMVQVPTLLKIDKKPDESEGPIGRGDS